LKAILKSLRLDSYFCRRSHSVGQATYQQFDKYFDSLKDKLLKLAEDKGIETRIAVDERYGEVALNPELTTEDDEDL
jgi:hypothetical protein